MRELSNAKTTDRTPGENGAAPEWFQRENEARRDAGSGAFDHDFGIDGFPENAFDAVLERHLGVRIYNLSE